MGLLVQSPHGCAHLGCSATAAALLRGGPGGLGAAGEQGPRGSSSSHVQPCAAVGTFTAFTRSGSAKA